MKDLSIAVLVDGAFFIKRYFKIYEDPSLREPQKVASELHKMALSHVGDDNYLYRILYYDSEPFNKKIHNPISNKLIDFSKTQVAKFRYEFFEELKKKRKVALSLGYLHESKNWLICARHTKELLKQNIDITSLGEDDVFYQLTQKGIDIKIGVDIASMAINHNIDRIILIAGDSDFVPAAKLTRREGIDFILDPMWNNVHDYLFEHIDGLKSICPEPRKK